MTCPYVNCGGEADFAGLAGPCGKCRQPVFLCPSCRGANRGFARHCRQCNAAIAIDGNLLEGPQGESESGSLSSESRRIELRGSFWIRPVARYGFLWCLSKSGEILRVSPFDSQALPWGVLGVGFGASPFTIAEIISQASKVAEPYLIATSQQVIKGVNLLNEAVKEFYSAQSGEYILSNISESYAGVEADEQGIHFLKKRDGQTLLSVSNGDSHKEFRLPVTDVAGPLKIGSRVLVYSRDHLFALQGDAIVTLLDFEAIGFKPWVSPPQETHFSPPFGRNPSLVRADSIYVPGERLGEMGLLFISLRGPNLNFAFIPARGESNFTQDEYGRPIIARPGEITAYEETSSLSLSHDGQLTARGQPYHRARLTVGFAKTAGGVESLRFYDNGTITDFSLISTRNLIDIGFFTVAGTLMFAYEGEPDIGNIMRVIVWEL
jgi:hypothetical protein